jgi:hypothetical protein
VLRLEGATLDLAYKAEHAADLETGAVAASSGFTGPVAPEATGMVPAGARFGHEARPLRNHAFVA